ncbi:hypothetical protein [Actinoplanes sp. N902-109]|uniref:hypothetical protein n=1 Tax=Actinoplanes sp. (strain N902-109) TaxID=649831 RepID=UPI00032937D9|nr:hypothetical protein [Actinoplanes sp. N902-109]AGL18422.1 hypothetical protein L083_4912 [Actinoplanes sp. N902-109]
MTTFRGFGAVAAAATVFLISACAQPAEDAAGAGTTSPGTPSSAPPVATTPDALLVRVQQTGGFVSADQRAGRLPATSVYADGRVIFEGPVTAIYPGPALPNVQVVAISPEQAQQFADQAVKAGVSKGTDFGRPGVADAPATRITAGGQTVTVEALGEARTDDPRLTDAQKQARTELKAFLDTLDKVKSGAPVAYEPTAVAAVVGVYHDPGDTTVEKPRTVAWPGPALPGAVLAKNTGLTCVTATGDQASAVLDAAARANAATPWSSGGKVWSVRLRPLLPDETSCADLA